jgi:PAS domain S-box-containing protein
VPLISRPYHLAVLRGRENIVAPLRIALDRLKNNGEFDRLVEQYLSSPVRQSWLERYAFILAFGGALVLLVVAGGTVWNRLLRRQVRARTKAVERTERRYRDIVDNASDMIYRTDPSGRFTFVNPVATRILGFGERELLAMKYFELMRPDWVPRAMSFYEKAAKTRESTYLEFPVRKKDGEEIWVGQHVRPIITGDRIEGFQGMARDITDRVNAQSELRAERDFVSAILDTAPSLIMVLDAQGHIVRFNRALRGALRRDDVGNCGPSLLGRSVRPRRRSRRHSRRHAAAGGGGRAGQARSRVARQERARHVIAWTVMALRGQHGQTSYLIGLGAVRK